MARYRLLSQHYSEEDKLLEPGTEVGDGCEHAWTRPPTVEMEPLDEAGMDAIAKERRRVGETVDPTDQLAMTMAETEETPPRRRRPKPAAELQEPADSLGAADEASGTG